MSLYGEYFSDLYAMENDPTWDDRHKEAEIEAFNQPEELSEEEKQRRYADARRRIDKWNQRYREQCEAEERARKTGYTDEERKEKEHGSKYDD